MRDDKEPIKYNNFTSGLAYDKNNNVIYLVNSKAFDIKEDYNAFKLSKMSNNLDTDLTLESEYEILYINVYITPEVSNRNIIIEWLDEPQEGCYEVRAYKVKYIQN